MPAIYWLVHCLLFWQLFCFHYLCARSGWDKDCYILLFPIDTPSPLSFSYSAWYPLHPRSSILSSLSSCWNWDSLYQYFSSWFAHQLLVTSCLLDTKVDPRWGSIWCISSQLTFDFVGRGLQGGVDAFPTIRVWVRGTGIRLFGWDRVFYW